ncbi:MAG: redox-sensing transcriptional repressor Rex [Candidatus Omnitrophota bacterium]
MITNKNCIIRLSRYKNALYRLKDLGFVKVFSDNLADAIDVTSSQVRKDFSIFGLSGNKRGGYKIEELLDKMNNILGKNEVQKVILAGKGKLGTALIKYKGFEKEGIRIVACFDNDPAKLNPEADIPVLALEDIKEFIKKQNIKVGIIAVPEAGAQSVADEMISGGIKGILNFAPIKLKEKEGCVINNVNLEIELENLIYFVNIIEKTKVTKN